MGRTSLLGAIAASLALAVAPGAVPARAAGDPGAPQDSTVQFARARRYYDFGLKAIRVGNFPRARRQFELAVGLLPAYPEAHLGLGHVAMTERRFEDALREYSAARDGYEAWEKALADVYVQRFRDSREEIQILRDNLLSLRGVYGTKIPATTLQSMILDIEGRIRRLESQRDPTPPGLPSVPAETHFYIGNALWRLDRPNDALEEWRLCAQGNPRFPLVYNNLAVAYWHRGEVALARANLERAEALGLLVPADFKSDLDRSDSRIAPIPGPGP